MGGKVTKLQEELAIAQKGLTITEEDLAKARAEHDLVSGTTRKRPGAQLRATSLEDMQGQARSKLTELKAALDEPSAVTATYEAFVLGHPEGTEGYLPPAAWAFKQLAPMIGEVLTTLREDEAGQPQDGELAPNGPGSSWVPSLRSLATGEPLAKVQAQMKAPVARPLSAVTAQAMTACGLPGGRSV